MGLRTWLARLIIDKNTLKALRSVPSVDKNALEQAQENLELSQTRKKYFESFKEELKELDKIMAEVEKLVPPEEKQPESKQNPIQDLLMGAMAQKMGINPPSSPATPSHPDPNKKFSPDIEALISMGMKKTGMSRAQILEFAPEFGINL